jgi:hypothetical protein
MKSADSCKIQGIIYKFYAQKSPRTQRGQVLILYNRIRNNGFAEPHNAQEAKLLAPVIFIFTLFTFIDLRFLYATKLFDNSKISIG